MRGTEILRLALLNIFQNKFKTIMTSIGIVVGAATIVMVIAIGRGGQMDVAEQFSNLNAGAIDVSYEWDGEETGGGSGGFSFESIGDFFGGGFGGMFRGGRGQSGADTGGDASGGGMQEGFSGGDFGGGERPSFDFGGENGEMPSFDFDGENGEMPSFDSGGENGEMPSGGSGEALDAQNRANTENESSDGEGPADGTDRAPAESSEDARADEENAAGSDASENAADDQAAEKNEDESSIVDERMNQENIILSEADVEDIETFVSGISGVTISYTTRASIEGGNLTESQMYTVAGVKESYAEVSKLSLAEGEFLTDGDDLQKSRVCVLGSETAKELFGSAQEAYGGTLYIDDRAYEVVGVLEATVTVSAGISPDEAIFIPYNTGVKYITGESISPTITVLAEDTNDIDAIKERISAVLSENYSNAEFTFSDAGSKMEAAESSNRILTLLLSAMAAIVFLVGGIGIMNVLFVSVKERTGEIGILKALGASRTMILSEFLIESAVISLIGGVIGVAASFAVTPVVQHYDVRVEMSAAAWAAALGFALLTGTLFGIYPAWKASRLVPVDALNEE